jgi:hypothetical protein
MEKGVGCMVCGRNLGERTSARSEILGGRIDEFDRYEYFCSI